MQRRSTRIMVTMALAMVFCGHEALGWYPYGPRYTQWQKTRPMLFAGLHNCVPRDRLGERIARFKAAGLNTFVWAKPHRAMHFFRAAHEAGLPWACWDNGGKKAIAQAMKIPGNAFIMTGDEPDSRRPGEIAEIARLTEWVRKNYPDTIAFTNLSIAQCDHDDYIKQCQPDVFSFDCYPLRRDGTLNEYYLYLLAWGRQTSMRHRLPYWMYLQSFGRKSKKPSKALRNSDEADVRFLVFTLLAHGGTGIQWFMYYGGFEEQMVTLSRDEEPRDERPKTHQYENAHPTRSWYAVRDVAPEVRVLSRALVNLRPTGKVGYVGNRRLWDHKPQTYPFNPAVPFRNERFTGRGALRSVEIVDEDKKNLGALVGFLDDQAGQEYFMVVNLQHGLKMSKMDGLRTVRLVFDPSVRTIERLNRLTGRVEVLRTKGGRGQRTLDVRLEGGTGDLFKWSDAKPWVLSDPARMVR